MSLSKRELWKYFRQVKAELFCPRKMRKRIMGELKGNVAAYLEKHPEATAEDLRESFGSPQQIAASYVEELSTPELLQKMKLRNRVLKSVIAVVGVAAFLCIVLWIAAIATALISVYNSSDPYIETYIVER